MMEPVAHEVGSPAPLEALGPPAHAVSRGGLEAAAPAEGGAAVVTFEDVRRDAEVKKLIEMADGYLAAVGYTDHGVKHVSRVASRARRVLTELGRGGRDAELAAICGLLHDIGNVVHRTNHAQTSAILGYGVLRRLGMSVEECATVACAIGNHDEGVGEPVSDVAAALILGDKSDVIRSRVRDVKGVAIDIHDRVNYAATDSRLVVNRAGGLIELHLTIDTAVSPVMEYFEIFLSRMAMCRRAAEHLGCRFSLVINETRLL